MIIFFQKHIISLFFRSYKHRKLCSQFIQLVKKSPYKTFFTALSAEHFESVQNAFTESLDKPRLSTAVYPI